GGDGFVARETLAAEGVGEALNLGGEALAVLLAAQSHDEGEQADRGGNVPEPKQEEEAAQNDGEDEAEVAAPNLLLAALLGVAREQGAAGDGEGSGGDPSVRLGGAVELRPIRERR